jgi:hypothetical protein
MYTQRDLIDIMMTYDDATYTRISFFNGKTTGMPTE